MALGRTVPLGRIPPAPLAMLAVEWVRRALAAMPAEFDAGTRLALRIADAAEARVFDPTSPADADLELNVHRWAEHSLLPRHAAQGFYFVVASMVRVAGIAHAGTNPYITLTTQNYLSFVRGEISSRTAQPAAAVAQLQRRTALRAKPPTLAQLERLPELRTPTIVGLARRLWQTRDPLAGAVLADALEEAGLAPQMAMPYRAEPETLTRADWLFWHLGCREFGASFPI